MADITITVSLRIKPWASKILVALAWICAVIELLSPRAAKRVSDKAVAMIAEYGFEMVLADA